MQTPDSLRRDETPGQNAEGGAEAHGIQAFGYVYDTLRRENPNSVPLQAKHWFEELQAETEKFEVSAHADTALDTVCAAAHLSVIQRYAGWVTRSPDWDGCPSSRLISALVLYRATTLRRHYDEKIKSFIALRRSMIQRGVSDPKELHATLGMLEKSGIGFPDHHDASDFFMDHLLDMQHLPKPSGPAPTDGWFYLATRTSAVKYFAQELRLTAEDTVYDVGAGPGKTGVSLHLLTGANVKLIELDRAYVAYGREKIAALGLSEKVSYIEGDAQEVPLDDATAFYLYKPFQEKSPVEAAVYSRLGAIAADRDVQFATHCIEDFFVENTKEVVLLEAPEGCRLYRSTPSASSTSSPPALPKRS